VPLNVVLLVGVEVVFLGNEVVFVGTEILYGSHTMEKRPSKAGYVSVSLISVVLYRYSISTIVAADEAVGQSDQPS
jgi:hypothetical protein